MSIKECVLISENENYNVLIDVIKGIGIICMVAGHCGVPFTKFIYLFHMAIFYIASGYCYKSKNSSSFYSLIMFIKRRIFSLWLPYVIWTSVYSILHNFFIRINIYTNNPLLMKYNVSEYNQVTEFWSFMDIVKNIVKSFILSGGTQIGGAFWFVAVLFKLVVIYCFIDFLVKKISMDKHVVVIIQSVISIIFLIVGYLFHLKGIRFLSLDKVFSYYILFHVGYVIKSSGIYNCKQNNILHILIIIITFLVLLICNSVGTIALDQTNYVNPVFLLIASICGWQFLYEISYYLVNTSICEILTCFGKNTMAIVSLHFLCFKVVNCAGVLIEEKPLFLIASFPVLYYGGGVLGFVYFYRTFAASFPWLTLEKSEIFCS